MGLLNVVGKLAPDRTSVFGGWPQTDEGAVPSKAVPTLRPGVGGALHPGRSKSGCERNQITQVIVEGRKAIVLEHKSVLLVGLVAAIRRLLVAALGRGRGLRQRDRGWRTSAQRALD